MFVHQTGRGYKHTVTVLSLLSGLYTGEHLHFSVALPAPYVLKTFDSWLIPRKSEGELL